MQTLRPQWPIIQSQFALESLGQYPCIDGQPQLPGSAVAEHHGRHWLGDRRVVPVSSDRPIPDERDVHLAVPGFRADVAALAACGFMSRRGQTAEDAAVIRSWQDRFGARLCAVCFDCLGLSVANPPVTPEHCLRVAAEHLAYETPEAWWTASAHHLQLSKHCGSVAHPKWNHGVAYQAEPDTLADG
jgi:hypothetical protein